MTPGFREVRVHLADRNFVAETCAVKFTLTYEGGLKTGSRSPHQTERKHEIRRAFHPQLRRLWAVNPYLSHWVTQPIPGRPSFPDEKMSDRLKVRVEDFEFVPLVTQSLCVECALDFRVLRPTDQPGQVSDIDNQVKQITDALKMPKPEVIKQTGLSPSEEEKPFFVLVEDDALITKISSINDELLSPIRGKDTFDSTDVRVAIDVYIRPTLPMPDNVLFFAEDRGVWDHKYDEVIPENLSNLSPSQLRSLATQCIFRIHALAKSLEHWSSAVTERDQQKIIDDYQARNQLWRSDLQPKAVAIKGELNRRIYGEPPYPNDIKHRAIDRGMLAGIAPLSDAAIVLETLVRQLRD